MKLKLDFKSIKFRIWIYFLIFSVVLLVAIWFLQIFFSTTTRKHEDSANPKNRRHSDEQHNKGTSKALLKKPKPLPTGMMFTCASTKMKKPSTLLPTPSSMIRKLPMPEKNWRRRKKEPESESTASPSPTVRP